MKPVKFKGHNAVLAGNQPQYIPLPVNIECDGRGSMVSCYKLSWKDRIKLLITGRIFFRQVTFDRGFHPIQPMTVWKDRNCTNCGHPIGDHKQKTGFVCPPILN